MEIVGWKEEESTSDLGLRPHRTQSAAPCLPPSAKAQPLSPRPCFLCQEEASKLHLLVSKPSQWTPPVYG